MTPDDIAFEREVKAEVHRLRIDQEARRRLAAESEPTVEYQIRTAAEVLAAIDEFHDVGAGLECRELTVDEVHHRPLLEYRYRGRRYRGIGDELFVQVSESEVPAQVWRELMETEWPDAWLDREDGNR